MNSVPASALFSFADLDAGKSYLSRLSLANPGAAQEQIAQFVDSLVAAPPSPADYLILLELARKPLSFVQEELGRWYHNKPLALADLEEGALQKVLSIWRKMEQAYALCIDQKESDTATPEGASRLALSLHRCLSCTGMVILEHYRSRRELPEGIWLQLHGYYQLAEDRGVALVPVEDSLVEDNPSTNCTAAYVTPLLVEMASPYSMSVRDINFIRKWASIWASRVTVHRTDGYSRSAPYLIELTKDSPLHPVGEDKEIGVDGRRIDTYKLSDKVKRVIGQLKEKTPPSRLGLGEITGEHAAKLLEQVSRPWSQSAAARKFRRFATSGTAKVCVGFEAMHYYISGREFEQPEVAKTYSRGELDAIYTFRQMADPTRNLTIRVQTDFPVDEWDVINHSANGFRLGRSSVGQKMAHGQLLAVCPHDGDKYLLAQSTWLMQERDGGLIAGLAVLPGVPAGVAVRAAGVAKDGNQLYQRAFMLTPVSGIAEQGSVVLPVGLYQASRVLDVQAGGQWQIRLKGVMQKGTDFVRAGFETV